MRYIAVIEGEPGAFGVVFPDLPGCTAMGDTINEAMSNAILALSDYAEDVVEVGTMPEPTVPSTPADLDDETRDALTRGALLAQVPLILETGKTKRANISMDTGLLDLIDETAKLRGLTRSAFLASAAREKIEEEA